MKDYYLQNIIDHFWEVDSVERGFYMCLDFIISEYRLEHISMEEFSLLVSITEKIKKLYDIPEFKK